MYKIKGAAFALIGLSVMVLLISLIMPGTVVINRTENIYGNPSPVIEQIKNVEGWKNWYPPMMATDVISGITPNGKEYLQWTRNERPFSIEVLETYKTGLRVAFKQKGEKDVLMDVLVERAGSQDQILWRAVHKLKWYPWEKFAGLFLNNIAGDGYQRALENLIKYTEAASSATLEKRFSPCLPQSILYL